MLNKHLSSPAPGFGLVQVRVPLVEQFRQLGGQAGPARLRGHELNSENVAAECWT